MKMSFGILASALVLSFSISAFAQLTESADGGQQAKSPEELVAEAMGSSTDGKSRQENYQQGSDIERPYIRKVLDKIARSATCGEARQILNHDSASGLELSEMNVQVERKLEAFVWHVQLLMVDSENGTQKPTSVACSVNREQLEQSVSRVQQRKLIREQIQQAR